MFALHQHRYKHSLHRKQLRQVQSEIILKCIEIIYIACFTKTHLLVAAAVNTQCLSCTNAIETDDLSDPDTQFSNAMWGKE